MAAAPRERSPFLGLLPLPERTAVTQALRSTGGPSARCLLSRSFSNGPSPNDACDFHRTSLSSDYSVSAGTGFLPWMSA